MTQIDGKEIRTEKEFELFDLSQLPLSDDDGECDDENDEAAEGDDDLI